DGRFREEAAGFGLGDAHCATDALFGDLDNDGHDDLYVVNAGPNVLYRKQGDGAFEGRSDEASNGLAILTLSEPLPVAFAVEVAIEVRELDEGKHNAFLILDYQGPEDFKFVGARADEGYWTIGHFDGAWVDDARLDSGIAPEESHALRLRIEGGRVELLPGFAGGDKNLVHDFGAPLHRGRIGFGVEGALARFDNLRIGPVSGLEPEPPSAVPAFYAERFADGVADGFSTASGSWQVVAWGFDEVSSEARADEPQFGRRGVLVDYDHDNDLDVYLANEVEFLMPADGDALAVPDDFSGQVNTLLRNNGNAVFTDQTDESGLLVTLSRSHDVVFGDFEGDSDTDLLVLHADAASRLFTNLRLGRFAAGGSLEPPLERDAWAAATGDFNRDGHLDLVVAVGERVLLYANDGAARFEATPVPAEIPGGVGKIEILDFNNDGWADLLLVPRRREGLALLAATGPAAFRDVSAQVGLAGLGRVADVAVGDLDGDGDQDLVALSRDDGLHLYDNRGGNQRHWLDVQLVGKKVNRSGYGATLEIASEGHYQKYLIDEGRIHLGLGELAAVDVVRVLWPNGVAQNVVAPGINTAVTIEEYVKVSASCGFLWASAGSGFELINEILGIGPLGAPIAPGVYHQPDSTELTLIEGDQLAPRDGRYELRLTEELREIMYADQISLRVIDHPAELEIVPNEKFVAPPFPEDRFFALADARPPRAAVDDQGRDVGELIARRDGRFPIFPRLEQYDGLAEAHALTLDLGELDDAGEALLFLDGWIYWPEASVSTAVAQDPEHELRPLELQVRNARGEWETAMTVGLPTSKGLVVPVELTPLLPLASPEIRLTTNMSIYFDRIFVATRDQPARCRTTELPVAAADLHYRGFSRLDRDDVGYERFDYDDVSLTGSWNPPRGMFTRYGDVTPLLEEPDDRYAIFGPGDELTMHFDAGAVPELPAGWRRDYIFYADGWVKDGDLNTKYSGTVEPLPFHGMSGYPYPETEHYPRTPETDAYLREYNTRPAVPTVGRLAYTGSGR
ncbi:MAG: CRTAC1 family protein, partial [bacterium]|nr:CRTAC1 family protein [bacterium]